MTDRRTASHPTASIAWMDQAYDGTSNLSPAFNSNGAKTGKSFHSTANSSSTAASLESFDRPESPTLPAEQNTSYSNNGSYDQRPTNNMPLPPVPVNPTASTSVSRQQETYNTNSNVESTRSSINPTTSTSNRITNQHHHHHHKPSKRHVHMSDHMAATVELSISPNVPSAPAAGMYWSRAVTYGRSPTRPLRAHSSNLIGENLYVFGGCDMKACFNTLYILDMNTLSWSRPHTSGQIPPPCRAHSCTVVERDIGNSKKAHSLYLFGGGDGPNYFNSLYVLNIDTLVWTKPKIEGEPPSPRRAHTACVWDQKFFVVGGGDGARALADVYFLDIADPQNLQWSKLQPDGPLPIARGYHTSNLVKNKLIVYGGSDGHECFSDLFVLDLVSNRWSQIDLDRAIPRLAHSATQIGSYIFIVGGHDGNRYSNEVLLLNLVTMGWETRKIYGGLPSPRGYHTSVLHDSRLYILGGYDGRSVFDDVYMLELSACAYLPQITNFEIDV